MIGRIAKGLLCCSFLMICGMIQSQESLILNGVVDGFDEEQNVPSLLHVRHFSAPAIGHGEWLTEALVLEDGSFTCDLGKLSDVAWLEFSAPPWSWMVLVRPDEPATLHLSPGGNVSNRLMQVSGNARWEGEHPSTFLDSLARFQADWMNELALPLLLKSEGIQHGSQDSLDALLQKAQVDFHQLWKAGEDWMTSQVFEDLRWRALWSWELGLGRSQKALDSMWNAWNASRPVQHLEERLASPGWFDGWVVRHDHWWKHREVDEARMNEAIFLADMDTLGSAMGSSWVGASSEDLAAAWLIKAMDAPDELTSRVWETMPFSKAFQDLHKTWVADRRVGRTGDRPSNIRWTLPNGYLDSLGGECPGRWVVMLVVRNGSASASREREIFSEIAENQAFKEICWLVLSVDATEEDWRSSLSARRSIKEQLVWLGNNPKHYEALGIRTIPQVISVDPQGFLSNKIQALPSQGLESEVERLLKSVGRRY